MTIDEIRKKYVGRMDEPRILVVEKGAIARYASAIGDENPIYFDEEYAKKTGYGSIISPLGFFGWPAKPGASRGGGVMAELSKDITEAGFPGILDGGIEYEVHRPIRAGDILVAVPKVESLTERETKAGIMLFRVSTTDYFNQNGDLAVRARSTGISRHL